MLYIETILSRLDYVPHHQIIFKFRKAYVNNTQLTLPMFGIIRQLARPNLRSLAQLSRGFATEKGKKYKVAENPEEVSKLVFNEEGLCKIY